MPPAPVTCAFGVFVLLAQQQFSGQLAQCASLAGEVLYRAVGAYRGSEEAAEVAEQAIEDEAQPVPFQCPALTCTPCELACPEPVENFAGVGI